MTFIPRCFRASDIVQVIWRIPFLSSYATRVGYCAIEQGISFSPAHQCLFAGEFQRHNCARHFAAMSSVKPMPIAQ